MGSRALVTFDCTRAFQQVIIFCPAYWLGHPEQFSFLLYNKTCIRSLSSIPSSNGALQTNFGCLNNITWLDLIFYCMANWWANKAYRLFWGGASPCVPQPSHDKTHLRDHKNNKKKHSSKRFGITIPIAVAIDDAACSLYDSINFGISGAFSAYIGEQYVIQNCGEEDLRNLSSWFVLQGCDILMVGHGIRTIPKILNAVQTWKRFFCLILIGLSWARTIAVIRTFIRA